MWNDCYLCTCIFEAESILHVHRNGVINYGALLAFGVQPAPVGNKLPAISDFVVPIWRIAAVKGNFFLSTENV